MHKKIFNIIQDIRKCFTQPQKFNSLKEKDVYFSALDVLEDSLEAIDYYLQNDIIENTGYKYLIIHGLLESLYMQQEALKDLYSFLFGKSLNFKTDYPEIYLIREIRNDISGHPTSRGTYSTYLSRFSIEKDSFIYTKNLSGEPITVETIKIIEQQEEFLAKFLIENILEPLKKEEEEHYREFKCKKLVQCFDGLNYANEKIYIPGYFYSKEDSMGFHILERILENFEKCLSERYLNWEETDYSYEIKNVHKIIEYIKSNSFLMDESDEEQRFIKINLLENLFTKMNDLYEIAKDIDDKYERYGKQQKTSCIIKIPEVLEKITKN